MFNKHSTFIILALVILVASALACNPPTPAPVHSTVTPYVPATAKPQDAPPEEATKEPGATEVPPPTSEDVPTATDTPPTDTPSPTLPPTPAPPTAPPEPTAPATVGTLNFEPPQFIDSWEPKGSSYKVVLRVDIVGGVPPFTVSHGPTVQGTTSNRVFYIEFEWGSCKSAMVQSITVESSDGQSIKKDYYIPVERMPWCATPSP
ncbi:MAG: hypothetical protein AB8I69_18125 [Anaerolineae bacterium]|jgi:hypothetical protein